MTETTIQKKCSRCGELMGTKSGKGKTGITDVTCVVCVELHKMVVEKRDIFTRSVVEEAFRNAQAHINAVENGIFAEPEDDTRDIKEEKRVYEQELQRFNAGEELGYVRGEMRRREEQHEISCICKECGREIYTEKAKHPSVFEGDGGTCPVCREALVEESISDITKPEVISDILKGAEHYLTVEKKIKDVEDQRWVDGALELLRLDRQHFEKGEPIGYLANKLRREKDKEKKKQLGTNEGAWFGDIEEDKPDNPADDEPKGGGPGGKLKFR